MLILNELTMLADLGMIERVMTWRDRLMRLLTSPEPTIEEATRAVVAGIVGVIVTDALFTLVYHALGI